MQGLAEYFGHCGEVTAVRLAGTEGSRKAWIEFGTKEAARSAREYDNTVSTFQKSADHGCCDIVARVQLYFGCSATFVRRALLMVADYLHVLSTVGARLSDS